MKQSKKVYARSEKHKWRDRYHGKRSYSAIFCSWGYDLIPSWFRRMSNREKKAKTKRTLHKILNGYEVEFDKEQRDLGWDWW